MAADKKATEITKAADQGTSLLYVPEDTKGQYNQVDTSYNFYSPMYSPKDGQGRVTGPEEFVILHGIPAHREARMQTTPDGESVKGHYYAVLLTKPCTVRGRVEGQEGLNWKIAPAGSWVLVNENAGLKALAAFLPEYPQRNDGKPDRNKKPITVYDVRIQPTAKRDFQRDGVSMKAWEFDIGQRVIAEVPGGKKLLAPAMPRIEKDEDGGQGLPF